MRRGYHGQIGKRGWIVRVAWWGRGLAGATLAVLSLDRDGIRPLEKMGILEFREAEGAVGDTNGGWSVSLITVVRVVRVREARKGVTEGGLRERGRIGVVTTRIEGDGFGSSLGIGIRRESNPLAARERGTETLCFLDLGVSGNGIRDGGDCKS